MEANTIAVLIGLSGISLGAFFSGLGYFLKERAERLKTKNHILFHLLGIRNSIKSEYVDPNELARDYLNYCREYFKRKGIPDPDNVPEELRVLVESHFKNTVKAVKPVLDVDFIKSFEEAVYSLSFEHPVLAFKLRGSERVDGIIAAQNQYLSNFDAVFDVDAPEIVKRTASTHVTELNYKVIEDLIKDIDNDIALVSASCGLLVRFAVRKIIRETAKVKLNFEELGLDVAMDEFLSVLVEAASKENQQAFNSAVPNSI